MHKSKFLRLVSIVSISLLSLLLLGCPEIVSSYVSPTVKVSSVTIDKTEAEILKGKTLQLTAEVQPSNASNKVVKWNSTNLAVAQVGENGLVTAMGKGSAVITATSEDGGKTASCAVTVIENVAVTGVTLSETSVSIAVGDEKQLTATVLPEDATNKKISWKTSNAKVATVDEEGTVSAVAEGKATITVTTEDGSKTATCAVTVTAQGSGGTPPSGGDPDVVHVTGVSIAGDDHVMITMGQTLQLVATVLPANATNKDVIWTSDNMAVASVSPTGLVTAMTMGNAKITVTTVDGGKTDVVYVMVQEGAGGPPPGGYVAVTGVSLDPSSITLNQGESMWITAIITPANATNKDVTWTTNDDQVAYVSSTDVDQSGNPRALISTSVVSDADATITVKTADGSYTAACLVTVPPAGPGGPDPEYITVSGTVSVTLDNVPVDLNDWYIYMYDTTDPNGNCLAWDYVSGGNWAMDLAPRTSSTSVFFKVTDNDYSIEYVFDDGDWSVYDTDVTGIQLIHDADTNPPGGDPPAPSYIIVSGTVSFTIDGTS